jgi:CheY-like chemotaxis protein
VRASSAGAGRGSTFEARLPLALAELARAGKGPAVGESSPRRILVAEDGEDTRESLGILLSAWKHDVTFADTGPEAVRKAREVRPDVALIDIGLPGFDGYAVAREIRGEGNAWSRTVRLVALTGYGQASDRTRALEAGFDVHMLKPVDPDELKVVISRPG